MSASSKPRRASLRDQEGAVAVMAAVVAAAMLLAGSLAVDVGRVAYVSRDQQGVTDRAALDAVRQLEGRGESTAELLLEDEVGPAVDGSLGRNPGSAGTGRDRHLSRLSLLGTAGGERVVLCALEYDPAGDQVASSGPHCGSQLDDVRAEAVGVETRSRVDFLLGLGQEPADVQRSAVAEVQPIAVVSAASSTASLSEGVVNDLLSALTLGEVSLDVVHYEGLAGATVELELLRQHLADVGLVAGSVDELVHLEVEVLELFDAMLLSLEAVAAQADDDVLDAGIEALEHLVLKLQGNELPRIRLGEILDLDTGGTAGLSLGVDALSLVMAGLQLANVDHAVELDVGVPWVAEAHLEIIEPPVIAAGPARLTDEGWQTVARTAQIDLRLEILPETLGEEDLGGALTSLLDGLLSRLSLGEDGDASLLNDPLVLNVNTGSGEVAVTGITCTGDGAVDVDVDVEAAGLRIEPVELVQLSASPLGIPLLDARVGIEELALSLGQGSAAGVLPGPFASDPVRVVADEVNLGGSISDNVELDVAAELLSVISVDAGQLLDPVLDILGALLTPVEEEVLMPLLQVLGVDLGAVEARALGRDCSSPRLAE